MSFYPKINTDRVLWIGTFLVFFCVLGAGIYWISYHPYGDASDEAYYINQGIVDYRALVSGDIYQIWGALMYCANDRPFAYRLIALPFTLIFGPTPYVFRASSVACFCLTLLFIFLAAKRIYSVRAGLIATLLFMLSPEVIASSVRFYMESSTYLALAAMLYFLFCFIEQPRPSTLMWVGLGLSTGLGINAKASYPLMVLPPLLLVFIHSVKKHSLKAALIQFGKPAILAFIIGAPWWILNFRPALMHIRAASVFPWCLDGHGLVLVANYARVFINCVTGPVAGIMIILSLLITAFLFTSKNIVFEPACRYKVLICLICGLFLIISQIASTNHCLRIATPAMVPIVIASSYFIVKANKLWKIDFSILTFLVLLVQLGLILSSLRFKNEPLRHFWDTGAGKALVLREQWDWKELYDRLKPCLIAPTIGFQGAARPMNHSSIAYPWIVNNEKVTVSDLGKYKEIKSFDVVLEEALKYDVVVTIADYPFNSALNFGYRNRFNLQLIEALSKNPDYSLSFRFHVGRFKETQLIVFVKNHK
ncbi:ArnT family glycosyltransferase [Anaerohalosphaeraceae bacterium U12dextr]